MTQDQDIDKGGSGTIGCCKKRSKCILNFSVTRGSETKVLTKEDHELLDAGKNKSLSQVSMPQDDSRLRY